MKNHPRASSYGPATLKVMGRAFDDAWNVICPAIPEAQVPKAREMLADVIMSVATDGCLDAAALSKAALAAWKAGLEMR